MVTDRMVTNLLLLGLSCLGHEHVCPGVLGEEGAGAALENPVLVVETEQNDSGEEDLWQGVQSWLVFSKNGTVSITLLAFS